MIRLASIIDSFESAFLAQYRERFRPEHTRALAAIKLCRTQASPKMQAACTQCDHQRLVPHSCGHRHCPHCQHHESQQWLERQLAKQVPAQYFLIVLPNGFRRARNFDFLHPNCKRLIALLRVVLRFDPGPASAWLKQRAPIVCACCGAGMRIVRTRIRSMDSARITIPIPPEGTR